MMVTVLDKIESGWIRLDWRDWLVRYKLDTDQLETILDIVDNFKRNRRAKDIVICRVDRIPAYVCAYRGDWRELLDWICDRAAEREDYEVCQRILGIQNGISYEQV